METISKKHTIRISIGFAILLGGGIFNAGVTYSELKTTRKIAQEGHQIAVENAKLLANIAGRLGIKISEK